jgi:hypothetical protein
LQVRWEIYGKPVSINTKAASGRAAKERKQQLKTNYNVINLLIDSCGCNEWISLQAAFGKTQGH